MKKIAFLLLVNLLLVNYSLEAQTEKGNWILGSTLGVYNSNGVEKLSSLNIDLNVGYFLNPHLAIGLRGVYIHEKSNNNAYDAVGNTLGLGIFGRHYFLEKKIKPFLDLNVGYQHTNIKWEDTSLYSFHYHTNYGLGLNYFITQRIAVEGIFRFNAEYFDFSFREMLTISNRDARIGLQVLF